LENRKSNNNNNNKTKNDKILNKIEAGTLANNVFLKIIEDVV